VTKARKIAIIHLIRPGTTHTPQAHRVVAAEPDVTADYTLYILVASENRSEAVGQSLKQSRS
jgi:hypothetical protein